MTKLLREMLQGILSREEIEGLAGGFDLIGDIAIVKLPEDMDPEKRKMVGDMLIKRIQGAWNKAICRYQKVLFFSKTFRREAESCQTCKRRRKDIQYVFWSGKLLRSEINEDAYRLMVKNIDVNKVKDKVYPLLGDCREHARNFDFRFDRIIMSLPEEAASYLPTASKAIRNGGTIHFYSMVRGDRKKVISEEFQRIKERYKEFELENARIVTEAGPRVYEVALDLVWRSS